MSGEISESVSEDISMILGFFCSIFSLVGALFTIFVYWLVPTTRKNFFFFLAFHLAISDFGVAITGMTLVNPNELSKGFCTAIATFRGFAIMSSFIINLMIALFLYKAIQTNNYLQGFPHQKTTFLISNYAFSLFGSIGPLLSGVYGPSHIYCWISTDEKRYIATFWLICEAYIALPLTLIWVILIYCWIIRHLKRMVSQERQSDVNKLALVPLFFVIANGITFVDIVIDVFFGKQMIIKLIHTCLRQIQGFFHALVYASGIVKEEIYNKLNERNKRKRMYEDSQLDYYSDKTNNNL